MPKRKADNRTRLLHAAEKTTYRYGFGSTAIADIAKEARVPLGNVYYYFKTKDEIGDAIVELRVSRFRRLLQELDQVDSPVERLCGFVQIKIKNREGLAHVLPLRAGERVPVLGFELLQAQAGSDKGNPGGGGDESGLRADFRSTAYFEAGRSPVSPAIIQVSEIEAETDAIAAERVACPAGIV